MENSSEYVQHAPWNKGVIVGQKSPFKLKEIWAIRVRLQLNIGFVSSPCSTWDSTANYGLAIWSRCGCATSAMANMIGQQL
jgi:hypothetical protein